MNIQSDITNNHNQDHRFKSFNDTLEKIEQAVFSSQELLKSHNSKIYNALCLTLELGYEFAQHHDSNNEDDDWQLLKDFLIYHDERWSAKCEANFFHGLVSVAFNQIDNKGEDVHSAPTLSKYRAILRYAFENKFSSEQLTEILEEKNLIDVYQDAISQARFDPIDNYVEDKDERFERATKELLSQQSLPNAKFTTDIPKPELTSEFATAIVKLNGSDFDVVGFVEDETEDQIKTKVISLVPDEAKYARRKLKDKNLYQFYACCDLFKRFIPNIATIMSWNKAHKSAQLPELGANSTQEDINEFIRALNARREADDNDQRRLIADIKEGKSSTVTKFMMLNALEFKVIGDKLIANSLTTHPNTSYLEFEFTLKRSFLTNDIPLMIKDIDATAFSKVFLESGDWALKRKEDGLVASSQNSTSHQLHIQDYSGLANWRTIDPSLKPIARFKLDKIILDRLSHWKSDVADTPRFTRKPFQSILAIEDKGDTLDLVFPNDRSERRTLGASIGVSNEQVVSNYKSKISSRRYFDIQQVNRLVKLALDYRIHFEIELLEGSQGPSAFKVHCIGLPFNASIILPLLLSVKGNPVEITK